MINMLWLLGTWQQTGFIYQGEHYPPFNPNLVITYEFKPDGTDILYWTRKNEPGFCRREGVYKLNGEYLEDHVTKVDPENGSSCASDSDMQLGHFTSTKVGNVNGQFYLYFNLNDNPLIYVWDKLN